MKKKVKNKPTDKRKKTERIKTLGTLGLPILNEFLRSKLPDIDPVTLMGGKYDNTPLKYGESRSVKVNKVKKPENK